MRHLNSGRKLNRTSAHRKALFRNLVLALIHHGGSKRPTPRPRSCGATPIGWLRWASAATLRARRLAFAFMQSRDAVKKLFDEIAPRFKERQGGYTRVVKFGVRRGDAAPLSIIEFTGASETAAPRKKRRKSRDPRASARRAPRRLTRAGLHLPAG